MSKIDIEAYKRAREKLSLCEMCHKPRSEREIIDELNKYPKFCNSCGILEITDSTFCMYCDSRDLYLTSECEKEMKRNMEGDENDM